MASSSTSSIPKSFKYDVFLSFRGEDTRKSFVDHLYHALLHSGIVTYKDDSTLMRGESIRDQVLRSIEDSKFHIVIFSKNYAASSWCLEELVKIIECQKTGEHTVYPIFYDVEPREVRYQIGAVGEAFSKHEHKKDADRWRNALAEAANLAGWELKRTEDGHEAKFIQRIVDHISVELRLNHLSFNENLPSFKDLVGPNDDEMKITGNAGSRKRKVVEAIFDKVSKQFKGHISVENDRESSQGSDLMELHKQAPSDELNDQSIDVKSVEEEEMMIKAHHMTSNPNVYLLSNEEANSLFNWYAFGRKIPSQGYEDLSEKIVNYCAGLPITIKLLGSFLYGRTKQEVEDTIEMLKSFVETLKESEIRYYGLENDYKEIFLDLACLLNGEMIDKAIRILESCGLRAKTGLEILEEKHLITISKDGRLLMDNIIEEMGRFIVRSAYPNNPSRHNLLWVKEEIEDVLLRDLGTEATRCIKLVNTHLNADIIMNGLRKMKKLRFLFVTNSNESSKYTSTSSYNDASLPNSLRYLYWHSYPLCCLPKTFQANMLHGLEMVGSNISELWEGGQRKVFNWLRFLDLSFSRLTTFDLGLTPCLEELHLRGCINLVRLHMPGGSLNLKFLNLSGSMLKDINLGLAPRLEKLHLKDCNDLVEVQMPVGCPKLKFLDISFSKLTTFDLGLTPCLKELHLRGCNDLVELHMPPVGSPRLKFLDLSLSKLRTFDLGLTPCLKELRLRGCADLVELHMPPVGSPKLKFLDLSFSKLRTFDLGLTPCLKKLHLRGCSELVELHIPVECTKLEYLNLSGSKLRNINLGSAPHLEELHLEECNDLVDLRIPAENPNLAFLRLGGSKVSHLHLGLTPLLSKLELNNCHHLQEIEASVGCLKKLVYLNSGGSLAKLKVIAESVDIHPYNSLPRFQFECFYSEPLPVSSGNLEKLLSLGLCASENLERFSASICGLQRLEKLTLEGSIPEVPEDIYQLESLVELSLSMIDIKRLPDSICKLKHLKSLRLDSCFCLEQLPINLGMLEGLEELLITECSSLGGIPNSICTMKALKRLHIPYCVQVEKLPKEFGSLKSLEELNIEGTCISWLPDSIRKCEGLCIIWSRKRLEFHGFTSLTHISKYTASCKVRKQ